MSKPLTPTSRRYHLPSPLEIIKKKTHHKQAATAASTNPIRSGDDRRLGRIGPRDQQAEGPDDGVSNPSALSMGIAGRGPRRSTGAEDGRVGMGGGKEVETGNAYYYHGAQRGGNDGR